MKEEAQYLHALEVAWEKMLELEHSEVAEKARVEFDSAKNALIVPFLNERYKVELSAKRILSEAGTEAGTLQALLILRYLLGAKAIDLANKFISFRDLHGGNIYYGVFERSVIKPIVKNFSSKPDKLIECASILNAKKLNYGDASIEIQVFPRLPIAIIVWKGDEEVPSSANVVFDESAKYQLSAEEICVTSAVVVSKLLKYSG